MTRKPKISIIIPIYKVEKYLRRCLDSVKNQTFKDWNAICIDDGSPDNSGKIADEYAACDKRFIVIHKKNAGVSAARNDGIKRATGKYIHFLDADDWIDSNYYEQMLRFADETCADITCSGIISNTKYSSNIKYHRVHVLGGLRSKLFWTRAISDSFVWRYLFKTDFVKSNKLLFDTKLISQEDTLFVLNAIKLANWITITPDVYYHYMFNETSALNSRDIAHHTKMKKHYKIGRQYRKQYAIDNGVYSLWFFRKVIRFFM